MTVDEVRSKYIEFFTSAPRNHVQIPPSPLVLENDPTTLFTNSGMQPLVPYLMGEKHPEGERLVDSQPSIRTIDIDEVGDNRHLTYFEMLGNWSLGDYFKIEQLPWIWEFYTKELHLPKDKLWVTVFEGNRDVPKDEESINIWKKLGVPEERIQQYGANKNWWSRAGEPEEMPVGEIGGPTSEVFYEFDSVEHDLKFGKECHPNCDCGRFIEIGNSVFMVYRKTENGLEELPNKNVDFGGGLERIVAATEDDPDVFRIDIFREMISEIEKTTNKKYTEDKTPFRIIADHIRAANALASNGVNPSNKQQGYVMRRIIRRSVIKMKSLKDNVSSKDFSNLTGHESITEEVDKFQKTLDKGLREFEKIEKITGKEAFDLYQTYGFPLEITLELAQEKGQKVNVSEFKKAFEDHKQKSRSASAGQFTGGLADKSEQTVKYHTATHLLQWALRKVLGDSVHQEGSNITAERLRFDFSHPQKLTKGEIKKVERLINEKVDEALPVTKTIEEKNAALKSGALAFFRENYPDKVSVYTIGKDPQKDWVSKELCGGPHVTNTSKIGHVRIVKQDKIGSGLIRVYVQTEPVK